MNFVEPKYVDVPGYGTIRICGLFECKNQVYARGICKTHYEQQREGKEFTPIKRYNEVDYGPCAYEGCPNRSTTKYGRLFCQGHMNHINRGEVPRDLLWQKKWGMTDSSRVCKNCREEKPLSEFYDRNQWKGGAVSKSTQCKTCDKIDSRYYRYQEGRKADGSDPKGYDV
jgi:hypothetical protein